MVTLQTVLRLDWQNLLFGQGQWQFLIMIAVRTAVMFFVILVGLRMLGKRGVSQLSVFELGVIVGLGSAAGDPMFYQSVGLISCILVFVIIIGMYHLLKYLIGKSDHLDEWVEGKPRDVVCSGELNLDVLRNETITRPELFSQLRAESISHLGQVKQAILEPSGEVSIFYYKAEEVKYGLPILPHLISNSFEKISTISCYSCVNCGHTLTLHPVDKAHCPVCHHTCWVNAINKTRIIKGRAHCFVMAFTPKNIFFKRNPRSYGSSLITFNHFPVYFCQHGCSGLIIARRTTGGTAL